MADAVLAEVADGIGIITINRPEARNAVNEAVARGVAAAIDEFDSRRDITSLILTGAVSGSETNTTTSGRPDASRWSSTSHCDQVLPAP